MNKTLVTIALLMGVTTPQIVHAQPPLTILHTNDLHSSLMGSENPGSESAVSGGFARLATVIRNEKMAADHPVIAVDAGDFLMGTLFQMLEVHSGFQLHLMHSMGYDAVSIGNHEFDFGPGDLAVYLRKAHHQGAPPLILSNIEYDEAGTGSPLAALYKDSILKTYHVIETQGIRIGLFGLLGDIAYEYTPNLAGYKQLDRVKTARKIVSVLRETEQADYVICLSHSGVYRKKNGDWDHTEDVELAGKVAGIDAIISGHTHTLLNEPLIVNGTPIVQVATGGRYLGKLSLNSGTEQPVKFELISIDQTILPDPVIETSVLKQFNKLKDSLRYEAGLEYDSIYFETVFPLPHTDDIPEETLIGPFIADAMYYTVNRNDTAGTDVAMIAQGMIRRGFSAGEQGLENIFRVASLGEGNDRLPGYPLARLYFTGRELKAVLELLHVVAANDPSYYCFSSGMEIEYKPKGRFLSRIATISILENDSLFIPVDVSRKNKLLYSVTADSYMMEFLTVLKKKSFGLINVQPKLSDGTPVADFAQALIDFDANQPGIQEGKVWKSMLVYASSFTDTDGNNIPEIPDVYLHDPKD